VLLWCVSHVLYSSEKPLQLVNAGTEAGTGRPRRHQGTARVRGTTGERRSIPFFIGHCCRCFLSREWISPVEVRAVRVILVPYVRSESTTDVSDTALRRRSIALLATGLKFSERPIWLKVDLASGQIDDVLSFAYSAGYGRRKSRQCVATGIR